MIKSKWVRLAGHAACNIAQKGIKVKKRVQAVTVLIRCHAINTWWNTGTAPHTHSLNLGTRWK